jgi:anthranilate phosphoribosyltransferase
MAQVFADRGDSVLLVRGEDGLDEFTTAAPTRVWVVSDGTVHETVLDSADLGIARSKAGDLRGADVAFNADVARRVFAGETGPVRDAVLVNAAAAIAARGGLSKEDLPGQLKVGIDRAAAAIDSGAASDLLRRWVATAQSVA